MADEPPQVIAYKRARFSTQLPAHYLYTRSHAWIDPLPNGTLRVGLTKFATRMLGEVVDYGFDTEPGAPVVVGGTIGWIEGFKAVSDLFCVANGRFLGPNNALEDDATLVNQDPHGRGWLYHVQGSADPDHFDVRGYSAFLDSTIDQLLQQG